VKTDDFNFDLPEELIAQYPTGERGTSRLFVLDRKNHRHIHTMVTQIRDFVEPGTVMVFNDSRVRKARLYGEACDTQAKVEFLLLAPLPAAARQPRVEPLPQVASQSSVAPQARVDPMSKTATSVASTPSSSSFAPLAVSTVWRAICNKNRRQRIGREYIFPGDLKGRVIDGNNDEKIIEFESPVGDDYLDAYGHVPLPPYIKREDEAVDEERYQNIYARVDGSAACATAGLHFTDAILDSLRAAGIDLEWVTLHVGLGTFLPVRAENIEDHNMHEEWYTVPEKTALAVNKAKAEGRKVLAVGTTSIRTLESAWGPDGLAVGPNNTSIFIYPGYQFKVVDQLFTNFHTPKSTLVMLVSAFAGKDEILNAYKEAVRERYRFFSYGDAMLIL